jgi:hypothetical protein
MFYTHEIYHTKLNVVLSGFSIHFILLWYIIVFALQDSLIMVMEVTETC